MKISAVLLTLALAQDGEGAADASQSQGAQASEGAQESGEQGAGYGEQAQAGEAQQSYGAQAGEAQQSYGGETQSYGGEVQSYAAPQLIAADICLGGCPPEAPCQNAVGACSPLSHFAEAHYESNYDAPQESYGEGAQASGYRQLREGSCPPGSVNTSDGRLTNTIVLWIGFILLFFPAMFFFCCMPVFTSTEQQIADARQNGGGAPSIGEPSNGVTNDPTGSYTTGATSIAIGSTQASIQHRIIAGVICLIASVAYLTMASGYGFSVRCCDGRSFYYARYIDWTLTTPLMLWEILEVSSANKAQRYLLFLTDIVMIISGLIGSLVCGSEKWAFFGFSMLTFVPILAALCSASRKFTHYDEAVFDQMRFLVVVSWFFYPIVWCLAEGTGTLSANAEAVCYTVLDIIAKSFLGLIIIRKPFAFSFTTTGNNAVAGTSLGRPAPTTTTAGTQKVFNFSLL